MITVTLRFNTVGTPVIPEINKNRPAIRMTIRGSTECVLGSDTIIEGLERIEIVSEEVASRPKDFLGLTYLAFKYLLLRNNRTAYNYD